MKIAPLSIYAIYIVLRVKKELKITPLSMYAIYIVVRVKKELKIALLSLTDRVSYYCTADPTLLSYGYNKICNVSVLFEWNKLNKSLIIKKKICE